MTNRRTTEITSSVPHPAVLRARLDASAVDPRLCFFSSPGDAVCGAYLDVAQRLANDDGADAGGVFVAVALEPTLAQSVVAANIGSALALELDVVLVDSRSNHADLFEVFGLGNESLTVDAECILVSDRLGISLEAGPGLLEEPARVSAVVQRAQSYADMIIVVADPDDVDALRAALEASLTGVVVLVEQASLATGRLESFVRETGADNILGCLVVEDGRLRAE